jgi:formate hydrogenlyase transcriptional activator
MTVADQDHRARRFEQIIGNSPALRAVLKQVERVASADSTVLIQGKTGTGKELVAHAIHNASPRSGRPLIKLNCAAIPFDLFESELFGHERGAFTGAIAQKIGRFELADKGTLFLDEVGDIPLALQPKLLRVLQEQEFERLGSCRTHRVDVRLLLHRTDCIHRFSLC